MIKKNILFAGAGTLVVIYVIQNELKHRKHKKEFRNLYHDIEEEFSIERKSRDGLVEIMSNIAEEMEEIREEIGTVYTHIEALSKNVKTKEKEDGR